MEYYRKAKEIMDMDAVELVGGASENEIENAERALSVVFPESYQAFLSDFGGGDVGGEIIFGLTNEEESDVVIATSMERSQGLPEKFVIIGFWSDTLVCLDTEKMNNGECPVVEVMDDDSETKFLAETFGKFLYEYLREE